jgi:hypothetical protein
MKNPVAAVPGCPSSFSVVNETKLGSTRFEISLEETDWPEVVCGKRAGMPLSKMVSATKAVRNWVREILMAAHLLEESFGGTGE